MVRGPRKTDSQMVTCYSGFVFSIGFVVGVFLALMSSKVQDYPARTKRVDRYVSTDDFYGLWLEKQGVTSRKKLDIDRDAYDPNYDHSSNLESTLLFWKVKVACAVFSGNIQNSYAVASSWGEKCNSIRFYNDKADSYLMSTGIAAQPSTWEFLCLVILDLLANVPAQWYVFAKDDVYVIPENLRYIVAHKNSSKPFYLGRNAFFWGTLFNTGKTAYVLSRGAVELIARKFNSSTACKKSSKYSKNEDYLMGKHLTELGVTAEDTRDEEGRERFHVFSPSQLLAPGHEGIFKKYFSTGIHPTVKGQRGFSPTSVSFQGIQRDYIFLYDYLLYHVKVFNHNGGYGNNLSRTYHQSDEVWKSFVSESLGPAYNVSNVSSSDYYRLWELWHPPEEFARKLRAEFLNKTGER
ncbi:Hypothetical protein NTJ_09122 [Nesidiocoris tenuis]|uniref:N-acetylgalactosaminide beta-1,3-galactosyltransferase n=1 Tax=Nesidiocoris tenuis TaxID=355587 RepID=A0ABN7AVW1_9HEMI|nr:Hypothetical protein NTJ_09122 [Nesidiocoris tenuis]